MSPNRDEDLETSLILAPGYADAALPRRPNLPRYGIRFVTYCLVGFDCPLTHSLMEWPESNISPPTVLRAVHHPATPPQSG